MGYVTVRGVGSGQANRYLAFVIAGRDVAVPLEAVREIRSVPAVSPLESAPAHVKGAVEVRGEAVSALDVAGLMGLAPWQPRPEASVILVRHEGQRVALLVDRATEIVELPAAAVHRPADGSGLETDWVAGIADHRGEPVVILDVARLVEAVTD